jgi:carbon storage regulator CsrA
MLALSRGEGQSIIIDGHIEVKIVKWSRSSVRLAIQAPREVAVDRDEIWRKMNPGVLTPLEKAEQERKERFAQGGSAPHSNAQAPATPPHPASPAPAPQMPAAPPLAGPAAPAHESPSADDMDEPVTGTDA